MQKQTVLQLIDEKLAQIEEAEKVNIWKSKITFGVHLPIYKQSPHLQPFLKKKKLVQRLIVSGAFLIPLLVLTFSYSFSEWPEESFWRTTVKILINSLFVGAIFIYPILRSLVRETISAQIEVKRLMLHDLRQKVEGLPEN